MGLWPEAALLRGNPRRRPLRRVREWPAVRTIHQLVSRIPPWLADLRLFRLASAGESWLSLLSQDPGHLQRRVSYSRLGAIHRSAGAGRTYPLFVMNRDVDLERLAAFTRRCGDLGIEFSRVAGMDAMDPTFDFASHREYIPEQFWGSTSFNRGVVGNFLTHIRIWQQMSDEDIEFAVVCEDDAYPLTLLPRTEADFGFPAGYDLVFINRRAASWVDPRTALDGEAVLTYVPFERAVSSLLEYHPRLEAPGAEGYAVSRKGARSLLRMARSARISCGDDWAMTLHSLSPEYRMQLMNRLPMDQQREIQSLEISEVLLETYVLLPGLIDHRDGGRSTMSRDPTVSRIERSAMGF